MRSMDRRKFIALAGTTILAPSELLAQPGARVYRIAIFDDATETARRDSWKLFRKRLGELGLVEGRNISFVARYAGGNPERLPSLAAELVALKPDIIVCPGTPAASVAMKATATIPIVFVAAGDPVGTGLVASLSRPAGNVTGTSNLAFDIAEKQFELLRELSPSAKRFAFLTNAMNKASVETFHRVEQLARAGGMTVQMLDGRSRENLERSLDTIGRERVQAFIVSAAGPLLEHRVRIVQFASEHKLPVVYGRREYVDVGGLLSYSADFDRQFVRGAEYVQRILQGAKPADLPVEQSRSLLTLLNMKTASALGIKISDSVRSRVDEMIQ
jgi:putative ABC transport system substrate-binding protein